MSADPWAFGWTQLLTIVGLFLTLGIAGFGFRGFERWRMEKLEERRIEIALEALALAYEAKYVFDDIRSPLSRAYESKDMPEFPGDTVEQRRSREPYFAILARIDRNKEYFERIFRLQSMFMALFGADKEDIFFKCHKARRTVEVSATMLVNSVRQSEPQNENGRRQRLQWECDIWDGMSDVAEDLPDANRVMKGIKRFQDGIVRVCKPIAQRKDVRGIRRFLSPTQFASDKSS